MKWEIFLKRQSVAGTTESCMDKPSDLEVTDGLLEHYIQTECASEVKRLHQHYADLFYSEETEAKVYSEVEELVEQIKSKMIEKFKYFPWY